MVHLDAKVLSEMERQHMVRYKQVRFFERQKAQRLLKKAEKQDANIQSAQIDFIYASHFPKTIKYIGMYALSENDGDGVDEPTTDRLIHDLLGRNVHLEQ